tara:strand:+ start:2297 stop:2461 length:165 start_codon:yes stop_codon:yes gene_type:complete
MPRKKPKKLSIAELKKKIPKIVFYTEKVRIQLSSLKNLDYWLSKYPNGKYVTYD